MKSRFNAVLVAGLLMALGPMAANADPITFNWSNNGSNTDLLSGSGSFTLDDSVLTPGLFDYAASITSFQFDWNTSAGPFSVNSGTGALAFAFLEFDPSLNVTYFNVCASATGACALSGHPLIQFESNIWAATLTEDTFSVVEGPQTVTVTVPVPEPGTLTLLSLGLLGLGLSRRKKA